MNATIALLPGDGVGPEVTAQARQVLETVASRFGHEFYFEEHAVGGQAMDLFGLPLPAETQVACVKANAVLAGPVGSPRGGTHASGAAPEQGISSLRKTLDLFAEVRPIRAYPDLLPAVRLRRERLSEVDVLIVLEAKFPPANPTERSALSVVPDREQEIRRLFHLACRLSQGRWGLVTSVHGEVPFSTDSGGGWYGPSPAWSRAGHEVARQFPGIKLEHQHVDFAAMRLLSKPTAFDVLVADGSLGRMLLDQTLMLSHALPLVPRGWLGQGSTGLYQPAHGPCFELTGKGMANPIGAILSAAMLLRYSLGLPDEAKAVEGAVQNAIAQGGRTVDMGGIPRFSTQEMGEAIGLNLEQDVGTDLARILGHWG